jgi:hypothetical protein
MKTKPSPSSKGLKKKNCQVWHFGLAIPALAVTLQVMLGPLTPLPQEHNPYAARYVANYPVDYGDYLHHEHRYQQMPEIEILPLHLRGEMTGPLLASVIKDYFPESTAEQAIDLRDTLPPCDNPRMIVILPKEEDPKPVF